MRILLDESLPKALRSRLIGHEAQTVVACGWSGIEIAAARYRAVVSARKAKR